MMRLSPKASFQTANNTWVSFAGKQPETQGGIDCTVHRVRQNLLRGMPEMRQ
jgi:hypothetical protein